MGFVQKVAAPIPIVRDVVKVVNQAVAPVSQVVSKALQPVEKAVVQPVGQGLASLDKSVGKAIPGGWGTIASIAGSAMGVPTPYMVGLGALNGSGVMRKGGNFNLQGAIMGGAMAYAASELGDYARGGSDSALAEGASKAVETTTENLPNVVPPADAIEALNASQNFTGPTATNLGSEISQSSINAANNATQAAADAASRINPTTGLDYSATGSGLVGNGAQPSVTSQLLGGNFGDAFSQIGQNIQQTGYDALNSATNAFDKATTLDTYTGALDRGLSNAGDTMSGIKNLVTGAPGASANAATVAKAAGTMSPLMATGLGVYSGMSLQALQQQKQYLQEQLNTGEITNEAYQAAVESINAQIAEAEAVVAANPLQTSVDTSTIEPGKTLYGKNKAFDTLYDKTSSADETLYAKNPVGIASGGIIRNYAAGGVVQPDDQTGLINQSPMTNINNQTYRQLPDLGPSFNWGNMQAYQGTQEQEIAQTQANQAAGINTLASIGSSQTRPQPSSPQNAYYSSMPDNGSSGGYGINGNNAFPLEGQYGIIKMAAGGMTPRFLSGGGDGMSDSIKANIGGTQEARLADGEFVVPADVVSHLGNGSSKAGAKQLYSMMDKVRTARTGRKSQGKQINPRKYLAA